MLTWTLLLCGALGSDQGAQPMPLQPAPAGARCVVGARPLAWSPYTSRTESGMTIDLDPEARVASPERASSLYSQQEFESLGDLRSDVMADGSLRLVLGDRLQSYSVLRVDGAGKLRLDCAHSEHEADRMSRTPAPARAREDR